MTKPRISLEDKNENKKSGRNQKNDLERTIVKQKREIDKLNFTITEKLKTIKHLEEKIEAYNSLYSENYDDIVVPDCAIENAYDCGIRFSSPDRFNMQTMWIVIYKIKTKKKFLWFSSKTIQSEEKFYFKSFHTNNYDNFYENHCRIFNAIKRKILEKNNARNNNNLNISSDSNLDSHNYTPESWKRYLEIKKEVSELKDKNTALDNSYKLET